jgi:hypothetical protein
MNDVAERTPPSDLSAPTIDERNPWLGLASFTEETREYFYGREEEVGELARRVQRKLLTVLFGQSGLGKTSILRAGLVPRLRTQGYCPVYVRVDYGKDAPEPAVQIKQAIARTARRSGEWTQAGVAVEGESLWEFLHHRDDVLQDESGATLTPLLIFDQFEEIFTLAQADEFGRARAARFIADLADLVENRPPRELEARLDQDDSAAERFDFARSDYRVLIALREDYLAPLEGLKAAMPSITQNRLRLAPMTGQQALAAVTRPGKQLVTDEVAAAIVRFVAGNAEIANAEVEPSLLSLICRELNDTRLAQGRSEISMDLLAGSHDSILTNFYERSLADQPQAVRRIIEDELLTASGFRENVAEERLLSSFAAAGAGPDTLATLVNRRLLRIEERLDVRRVELTHDVLCGVVKNSRDLRHERETREATQRLLDTQRKSELAARSSLVRARQVAVVCTLLAIGAIAAAGFAYVSTQRARRAERQAEETRATAEQARGQAEHLLGYLTDDFSRELENSGRLDVVAELAKRQMDYFNALPPALKGPETMRNGALAMFHYAKAMRNVGDAKLGSAAVIEAMNLLEQLRRSGDTSEQTTIALATATDIDSKILDNADSPDALPTVRRAAALIAPLAEAPNPSVAARRAYMNVLVDLGFQEQLAASLRDESIKTLRHAMTLAASLGADDLSDLDAAAGYSEAETWQIEALIAMGRKDEAQRVGSDAVKRADKVLDVRPGHLSALHSKQVAESSLADLELDNMRPLEAMEHAGRSERASLNLVKLDARNTISFNNLAADRRVLGEANWSAGRVAASIHYFETAHEAMRHALIAGNWFVLNMLYPRQTLAIRMADAGDAGTARITLADAGSLIAELRRTEPPNSPITAFGDCLIKGGEAGVALWEGDAPAARRIAEAIPTLVGGLKPRSPTEEFFKNQCRFYPISLAAQISFVLADYPATEREALAALEYRKAWPLESGADRREAGAVSTLLAISLARQGKAAEAQRVIRPVLDMQREFAARNHGDQWQHVELAAALYAQALADKARSGALLHQAAALIESVPLDMRQLHSVRLWRDRILDAQRASTQAAVRDPAARKVG